MEGSKDAGENLCFTGENDGATRVMGVLHLEKAQCRKSTKTPFVYAVLFITRHEVGLNVCRIILEHGIKVQEMVLPWFRHGYLLGICTLHLMSS